MAPFPSMQQIREIPNILLKRPNVVIVVNVYSAARSMVGSRVRIVYGPKNTTTNKRCVLCGHGQPDLDLEDRVAAVEELA